MRLITLTDIITAQQRLKPLIRKTPVIVSQRLNASLGGHELFFKAENLQHGGAFKARGALNALTRLKETQTPQPVVTYSSGNHAIAIAWAGAMLGIPTRVHMPTYASAVKRQTTERLGAEVVLHENRQAAEAACKADCVNGKRYCVPPFDHDDVIAGQGTAALEFHEQTPELDASAKCLKSLSD